MGIRLTDGPPPEATGEPPPVPSQASGSRAGRIAGALASQNPISQALRGFRAPGAAGEGFSERADRLAAEEARNREIPQPHPLQSRATRLAEEERRNAAGQPTGVRTTNTQSGPVEPVLPPPPPAPPVPAARPAARPGAGGGGARAGAGARPTSPTTDQLNAISLKMAQETNAPGKGASPAAPAFTAGGGDEAIRAKKMAGAGAPMGYAKGGRVAPGWSFSSGKNSGAGTNRYSKRK
jgi:hypothetical protein